MLNLKISKNIIIIFLCLLSGFVFSQNSKSSKSDNIVMISGKSYYIHTVKKGETLSSIANVYGMSYKEIMRINEKKDTNINVGEVIRIPLVDTKTPKPKEQNAEKYIKYRIKPGDSLYKIAKEYNISLDEIFKANPKYNRKTVLQLNKVILIPKGVDDDELSTIPKTEVTKNDDQTIKFETTKKDLKVDDEGWISLDNKTNEQDNKSVVALEETIGDIPKTNSKYVKVAVLLPLYSNENIIVRDSLGNITNTEIKDNSSVFLELYEGILLSVDSLKNIGYNVDMKVFDTEMEQMKLLEITSVLNRWEPNIIIGPIYESSIDIVAGNLWNKNIPIVYPLSVKNEVVGKYPNFIQVNTPPVETYEDLSDWVVNNASYDNILSIHYPDSRNEILEKMIYEKKTIPDTSFRFTSIPYDVEAIDSLHIQLDSNLMNTIILPVYKEIKVSTVLPRLQAYTTGFKIRVIGLNDWLSFKSLEPELLFKMNTTLFTYNYNDINTTDANRFRLDFINTFNIEPSSISCKGYDMGLYFIKMAADYSNNNFYKAIEHPKDLIFSRFKFNKIPNGLGYHNRGWFKMNFTPNYKIHIE